MSIFHLITDFGLIDWKREIMKLRRLSVQNGPRAHNSSPKRSHLYRRNNNHNNVGGFNSAGVRRIIGQYSEMETEVMTLKTKYFELRQKYRNAKDTLKEQRMKSRQLIVNCALKLQEKENEIERVKNKRRNELTAIGAELVYLRANMIKEQKELKEVIRAKEKRISELESHHCKQIKPKFDSSEEKKGLESHGGVNLCMPLRCSHKQHIEDNILNSESHLEREDIKGKVETMDKKVSYKESHSESPNEVDTPYSSELDSSFESQQERPIRFVIKPKIDNGCSSNNSNNIDDVDDSALMLPPPLPPPPSRTSRWQKRPPYRGRSADEAFSCCSVSDKSSLCSVSASVGDEGFSSSQEEVASLASSCCEVVVLDRINLESASGSWNQLTVKNDQHNDQYNDNDDYSCGMPSIPEDQLPILGAATTTPSVTSTNHRWNKKPSDVKKANHASKTNKAGKVTKEGFFLKNANQCKNDDFKHVKTVTYWAGPTL